MGGGRYHPAVLTAPQPEPAPVQALLARHLGDAVLALPALRLLAASVAPRRVVALAEGAAAQVLVGHEWDVASLHQLGPGPAVLLSSSLRSALQAVQARSRPRIGEATDSRRLLLTDVVPGPAHPLPVQVAGRRLPKLLVGEHQGDAYLRIVRAALGVLDLDAPPRSPQELELELELDRATMAQGQQAWEAAGRPSIILHPCAAGASTKLWPTARWIQVAKSLGDRCVVTGGPSAADASLASQIGASAGVPVLAGHEALRVMPWASFALAAGTVVSPDTGIAHLARAVGARVVVLFGSSDPRRHAPRGPGALSLLHGGADLPCSPCYRDRCSEGGHACMESITVADVLEAVTE